MKLSIIVTSYNVEKYIGRCLDSLIDQDLKKSDYEIIIINDGSFDKTPTIAKNYAKKISNIYVYNQENKGVGLTRNLGIKLAKGKYVYFIDPDDYLASNVLKTMINYGDKYNVDVLTFKSRRTFYSNLLQTETDIKSSFSLNVANGIDYIEQFGFQNEVWWYIIKKDFLLSLGLKFIEGRWMEDGIFTVNLFLKTNIIIHLPIDAHRHLKTPKSAMTNKKPSHFIKVIYDMENAAIIYKEIIERVQNNSYKNENCVKRLKERQQAYVFFMMIRILKSTIKLKNVKTILNNMINIKAYPLNSFLGKDYNQTIYKILLPFFNYKYTYYLIFLASRPLIKLNNVIRIHK